jgi:hypothetical protein
MVDSRNWSVDRLAAQNLLASLRIDSTGTLLEVAAGHLARHREASQLWAVERAHSGIIRKLETASSTSFDRRSEQWTEGYRSAEALVVTMLPKDLLETVPQRQGLSRSWSLSIR